jgi:hypothetical protein
MLTENPFQLIWKSLESSYTLGQFDLAEKWCRLGLHNAFENSGPGNMAKLERWSRFVHIY